MKILQTKKLTIAGIAIVLFSMLSIIWSCNKEQPPLDSGAKISASSNEIIASEVNPILQDFFNAQYMYLTNKSERNSWTDLMEFPESDVLLKKIDHLKSELNKINFRYIDFKSDVHIDNLVKSDDKVILKITDNYSLTTNDKDPDEPGKYIITEGQYEYSVDMKYINGKWVISNLSNISDDPWFIILNPEIGVVDTRETGELSTDELREIAYTYSGTTAKNYAWAHYNNPSPYYCNFGTNGGGDCTNFLSQCLMVGGWSINSSWWAAGNTCCNQVGCIPTCWACSWTVANTFKNYAINSGRIYSACYVDNALYVGDIMQFRYPPSTSIGHSALVTKRTVVGSTINVYVTYRNGGGNPPAKDKLSSLMSGIHYGWRVKPSAN